MMESRPPNQLARTAGLLTVVIAWATFLTLTGSPEAILFTVPVFLLAAPLALGRYIGEEAIEMLRRKPARRLVREIKVAFAGRESNPAGRVPRGCRFGRAPPLGFN